jgi:uncharacterized protein with FMN-binding domain
MDVTNRLGRHSLISLSAIALAILALSSGLASCKSLDDINKLAVTNIDISKVHDGSYVAKQDNKLVMAQVRVDVAGGRITSIAVLAHNHGPGHGAEAIVNRVMAAQSLEVDAISGATYSSKVMRKAIELALDQGL